MGTWQHVGGYGTGEGAETSASGFSGNRRRKSEPLGLD